MVVPICHCGTATRGVCLVCGAACCIRHERHLEAVAQGDRVYTGTVCDKCEAGYTCFECGMLATRECGCGRRCCASHSLLDADNRVDAWGTPFAALRAIRCTFCLRGGTDEALRNAAEERISKIVAELTAVVDPTERLVRAISVGFSFEERAFRRGGTGTRPYDDEFLTRMKAAMLKGESVSGMDSGLDAIDRIYCSEPVLRALFPNLWPASREVDLCSPPWDDDEIQKWFLRAIRSPAPDSIQIRTSSWLGREKTSTVRGWRFDRGSTLRASNVDLHGRFQSISITFDGRRVYETGLTSSPTREGFNGNAVYRMGRIVGLS